MRLGRNLHVSASWRCSAWQCSCSDNQAQPAKAEKNPTMVTGFEFVILVFSIYVLAEIIRRVAAHRAIAKDKRSQGGADR